MKKYVTFAVDCTYTVELDLPDGEYSDDEIRSKAEARLDEMDIDIGDLENAQWDFLQVDDNNEEG